MIPDAALGDGLGVDDDLIAKARDTKLEAIRRRSVAVIHGDFQQAVTLEPRGPGVLLEHDLLAATAHRQTGIQPHPRLARNIGRLERGGIGNLRITVGAVEAKALAHFAGCKERTALQRGAATADSIRGISIARPPTGQARRRWDAVVRRHRRTLARAAGVVNGQHFAGGQRAVEQGHLVNVSRVGEIISAFIEIAYANPGGFTRDQIAERTHRRRELRRQRPIRINAHRPGTAIQRARHMRPLMVGQSCFHVGGIAARIRDAKPHGAAGLHAKIIRIETRTMIAAKENKIPVALRPGPGFDGQRVGQHIGRLVGKLRPAVGAVSQTVRVKMKRLPHDAVGVAGVLQHAVVATHHVADVAVRLPPTDHSRRWRDAIICRPRRAFARAAGSVDVQNFRCRECAVVNGRLVYLPVEIPAVDAVGANSSTIFRTDGHEAVRQHR